jgi:AcrR family transcriptional regulator
MREKKFERLDPNERQNLLIQSAIRCLKSEGYAGLSVRKITKEANVSQGMINLHFGSIHSLISQAYDVLSHEFYLSITQQLEVCNGNALDKLDLFFKNNFSEEAMNPDLLKAWLVFWSLIPDSPEMAEAYTQNNKAIENLLSRLLTDISAEEGFTVNDISIASQSLMALLDGIWVRECLENRQTASANALKVARNWVDRFRDGMFNL